MWVMSLKFSHIRIKRSHGGAFAAAKAHLKLGGQELTLPVKPNAKSVTFKLKLKPGRDELWAKFTDAEGTPMGAFYAYVTKLK